MAAPVAPDQEEEERERGRLALVADEIARLENSTAHLVRSNAEMAAAHAEDPDPVYPSSIAENEDLIARQRQRIDALKAQLQPQAS